ncbi:MAG TPA: hypothetical protein VNZ54_10930 [bacterium]|nr:hypothetical protein [bacterium]
MRGWGSGLAVALLALGLSAGLKASGPLNVVMQDGTVVRGTLLGVDQGTATLQKANGKTVDLDLDQVSKAFDADGNAVSLTGAAAQAKAATDADEDAQVVPRDRRHQTHRQRSPGNLEGRKVAGNVLFWTGTAFVVVGVVAMGYGVGQMDDATQSYYTSYYNNAGADYQIDGYPGYYTYDQTTQYYDGEDWAYTGAAIATVGVIGAVVGLCIRPTGRELRDDALLHYEGGKLSLGLPPVSVDARLHAPRATLATVQF